MSQKSEPIIAYFRPGQLIFHFKENMREASQKIHVLMDRATTIARSNDLTMNLSYKEVAIDFVPKPNPKLLRSEVSQQEQSQRPTGSSYKSPETELPNPFSLVVATVQHDDRTEFPEDPEQQTFALEQLLKLAIVLNNNLNELRKELNSLVAVSPNWLMNGSPSSPGSTGGPGGRPSPYAGSANTDQYDFAPAVGPMLQKISEAHPTARSGEQKVVVAILDTVPTLEHNDYKVLDRIYAKWSTQGHSLINSLLGKNGKLKKIYFDDEVDQPIPGVQPDGYVQVENHDYLMTDHGLFAVGLIHSLAPQAQLHLFQVLSRYGVGDLLSIARALKQIHDDDVTFPKHQLVVNLSLTINIPIEVAHGKKDNMSDDIRAKILKIKNEKVTDMATVQTITWICDSLHAQGAKVIAAAGNNGESNHRPQACFPAAFESVLGVGALPIIREKPKPAQKKLKTASYSNRSDRPEWTGVTTLGGETEKGNGVLGIYVGDFPPDADGNPQSNDSGWAWWAGTSFATPIISGMTAAVRGLLSDGDRVEDAVSELLGAQQYTTEDFDEDVLWVKQGT